MPWALAGGAIAAGGAIIGAGMQADAGKKATDTQLGMFNQIRNDLAPYNQAGQGAVNALSSYWGLGGGGGGAPGAGGGAGSGGPSPGMIAAQAAGPHSKNGVTDGLGGFLLDGGVGLFRKNASPIQDIAGALAQGRTITDSQWAQAGYGPGGSAPGGMSGNSGAGGGQPGPGLSPTSASNAFDALQKYPGYQFQYDQGLQALNRNLTSGGRYISGAMLKDSQTFGQGQAQSSVTNYLDMLKYLGSLGESAGAQTGAAGIQTGQGIAQTQAGMGTAGAAGVSGAASAISGVLGNSNFQNYFGRNSGKATYDTSTGNWTPGPGGF